MNADPWVSVSQVAEHIGVSQDIIYKWIKERHMPAHRIGKFWKFQISEVDKWIKSGDGDKSRETETKEGAIANKRLIPAK
jgi:excisionase family DNA binding protein